MLVNFSHVRFAWLCGYMSYALCLQKPQQLQMFAPETDMLCNPPQCVHFLAKQSGTNPAAWFVTAHYVNQHLISFSGTFHDYLNYLQ